MRGRLRPWFLPMPRARHWPQPGPGTTERGPLQRVVVRRESAVARRYRRSVAQFRIANFFGRARHRQPSGWPVMACRVTLPSVNSPSGPSPGARGTLPALTFGDGPRLVVAVHGITASAMEWPPVARQLSAGWTLVAPDLRGRGAAAGLPGPYGLAPSRRRRLRGRAVPIRTGSGAVLVGHSMGAYIALLAAAAEPRLFRRLVLVDGGLPFPPPPEGVSVDDALTSHPRDGDQRLSKTFEDLRAGLPRLLPLPSRV